MTIGYNKPLYILPFDHTVPSERLGTGGSGALTPEQTEKIAADQRCDL